MSAPTMTRVPGGWEVDDRRFGSRPPERSLQQRMDALAKGNAIRTQRARLKKEIGQRRELAIEVLLDPPAYVETMQVADLLLAIPKWGQVKVGKALKRVVIAPSKTIGGLSQRQRVELASLVRR